MGTTQFKGKVKATEGFIGQNTIAVATFSSASAAETTYCIAPVTGNVTAVYGAMGTAARAAVFTVKSGSAGDTIATITAVSTGVAGAVFTGVLGTVAVTAGQSISVARGTQGSTGASTVSIVIEKTV